MRSSSKNSISMTRSENKSPPMERVYTAIIGAARNAKYSELRSEIQPEFILPYRQRSEVTGNNFYVRTAGSPARILAAIPQLIAGIDSNVPVDGLRTMPAQFQACITIAE